MGPERIGQPMPRFPPILTCTPSSELLFGLRAQKSMTANGFVVGDSPTKPWPLG